MNDEVLKDLENRIRPLFGALKQEFITLRTNRPSPKLVEDIKVDYFDQKLTVKQLGSISVVPPREINIQVWDKNAVAPVAKAIEASSLGVSANIDGNLIRINLPTLTDERRQELTRLVKSVTEQTKIKVRNLRDDANKKIEQTFKDKKISEDQKFKLKKQIQDAIDKINKEIENLLEAKTKEINEQ
ncbi:MAG: ribosome recycling factor [Candidatus Harrisonbacteria bacterium RIFCSPLOWO2_01_FULL_44_18]|uniref:Ribosome-recycling factor n=1 Tax=Candidatus Harrisonbacteria bacterium RIFCSPLOWO2_01_FULL_44_18 TaxID=1798407 RepID=A0A1G1ZPW2_9BACT|nr:MAG: ribosome recycling factor [Candidatus Harrisonbacteria bacterium RIFCSPLOWO2_01_FULL_44_18]